MKPFDLEKALAGEPVVTRDGRPAKIGGYNPGADDAQAILGWIGAFGMSWYKNGFYVAQQGQHPNDILMAEKPKVKKEGWVNVYRKRDSIDTFAHLSNVYFYKEAAERDATSVCIATVKIEWEEEAP